MSAPEPDDASDLVGTKVRAFPPGHPRLGPAETPVGQPCASCGNPIAEDDRGFSLWHMGGDGETDGYRPWHEHCLLGSMGIGSS